MKEGVSVAIVGARRVRQGLGPFVAPFLQEHGVRVAAVLGTNSASAQAAVDDLKQRGVMTQGYDSLETLLEKERPQGLVILSPPHTHGTYLQLALEAGQHVLCEKPFLWDRPDPAGETRALWEAFAERGLLLRENCQWPKTLPAFWALHPAGREEPLRSFEMALCPASRGAQMIGDALPHPLSLLQALLPDPEAGLEDVRFSTRDPETETLEVRFAYGAGVQVLIQLRRTDSLPREASLCINGRRARRRVRPEDYALSLEDGGRTVPLADPLGELLADFAADLAVVAAGTPPQADPAIPQRAKMLAHLHSAFLDSSRGDRP